MSSTDARVKQVYFPLDRAGSEYHLLSILAPAGMIFALKDRIVNIRKNENEDLPNLTRIKYSAKPQNISYLSSQYGGSAYLLPSFPQNQKNTLLVYLTLALISLDNALIIRRFKLI